MTTGSTPPPLPDDVLISSRDGTVSVAPEPVLGIHADPVDTATAARDRRLARFGRMALVVCLGSAVLLASLVLFAFVTLKSNQVTVPAKKILGWLAIGFFLSQLVGLPLSIYSRKAKTGKAALIISIFFDALMLAIIVIGIMPDHGGRSASNP